MNNICNDCSFLMSGNRCDVDIDEEKMIKIDSSCNYYEQLLSEKIKGTHPYVSYVSALRVNELLEIIYKEDEVVKYSKYCKKELCYGHMTVSSFNSIIRNIKLKKISEKDIRTESEIIESHLEYVKELKANRIKELEEVKRKINECTDVIEYLGGI